MKITTLIQSTVFAAACMVATSAEAQNLRVRTNGAPKLTQAGIKTIKEKISKVPRTVTINPSDYGTVEDIMLEDFSKFATGTEEAPDFDTDVILDQASGECEYGWWNVNPSYTKLPKWGGSNLFPAGGKVFMLESVLDGQTHINTPMFDFTKYDGVCCLEFKARTTNPKLKQRLVIQAADTYNMAPEWKMLGSQATPHLTTEWQKYSVIYFGAEKNTLFNLVPQMEQDYYENQSEDSCQILLDDFRVFSIIPYVSTPVNLGYKNYKGSEFDLTWDAVDGADSYVVNVWELDMETGDQWEFVKDTTVTSNTYHVEEAFDGCTYIFNVVAQKGEKKSFASEMGIVFDITDPTFTSVPTLEKVDSTGLFKFTSQWSEVGGADVYNYSVWHKRMSWYDHNFIVTEENFNGLLNADGMTTEFTVEAPDYNCYGRLPLKPLKQPGWIGTSYMPFKGFVAIDGWQHIVAKADAYIASPELDLSKDEGKLHMSVKLFGKIGSWVEPITQIEHKDLQTKCAVSLYNFNEATGKFEQAEYVALNDVTPEWKTFEVDLTKGSKRSYIVLEAIEGPEHLYIDDLKITQNYKKGEYLVEPCIYEYWLQNQSYDAVLPAFVAGEEISERVSAERMNPFTKKPMISNTAQQVIGQAGEYPSGIQDAAISGKLISFENGQLNVNNANGEAVNVYAIDGRLVYSNGTGAASISVRLVEKGAYVVKVGNKSVKLYI